MMSFYETSPAEIGRPPNLILKKNPKCIYYKDIDNLYRNYITADILVVDDDPFLIKLIENKIKKMRIKSNDGDPGRPVRYKIINNSKELLEDIIEYHCTYGVIFLDENMGPDNLSGSQCISRIRNSGYENPIFSISGSFKPSYINAKVKNSGADGLIPKSPFFFSEIRKILFKLTKRNLKSE